MVHREEGVVKRIRYMQRLHENTDNTICASAASSWQHLLFVSARGF